MNMARSIRNNSLLSIKEKNCDTESNDLDIVLVCCVRHFGILAFYLESTPSGHSGVAINGGLK